MVPCLSRPVCGHLFRRPQRTAAPATDEVFSRALGKGGTFPGPLGSGSLRPVQAGSPSPPPQASCPCTGVNRPVTRWSHPAPCPHFCLLHGSGIDLFQTHSRARHSTARSLWWLCIVPVRTSAVRWGLPGPVRALVGWPRTSAHTTVAFAPPAASHWPSGRALRHSLIPAAQLSAVPRRS